MRDLVKERSKTLEETLYLRSRVEEESELLKRRLDAMARVENPAEMKLAKEREEYKVRRTTMSHNGASFTFCIPPQLINLSISVDAFKMLLLPPTLQISRLIEVHAHFLQRMSRYSN
jgi:hypothetical protein